LKRKLINQRLEPSATKEAKMSASWIGIVIGTFALVIAAIGVAGHYRREHRREQLLRNLDHHDGCHWIRARR
jgi:hypothetical protein